MPWSPRWRFALPLLTALVACDAPAPTQMEDMGEPAPDLHDQSEQVMDQREEHDALEVGDREEKDEGDAPPALPEEPFGPAPARPAAPVREVRAWILLSDDPEAVARNIARAPEFGVEEVHLSHDLISTIDKLRGEQAAPLLGVIEDAKARGLRVLVWSNELNNVPFSLCFDPGDPLWASRQQEYRDAFAAAPALDGVILSFGSANPPPWLAGCLCAPCLAIPSDASPVERPFLVPAPPWRIRFVMNMVHNVVHGELGKELYARTFIHEPQELGWMREAVQTLDPAREIPLVTKEVPNDWQPYYPLHPLFGAAPGREPIIELDAAGEYWGVSAIPFVAVGHFERRLREARAAGLRGYAARVERGGRSALETPNEANLYAVARFFDDPEATTAQVLGEWIERRYGLPVGDPRAERLAWALEGTYEVGRKLYYQGGFWTLEKGSNLPGRCDAPALLEQRRNDKWDPAWAARYAALDAPTPQTLADLRQEDLEALERAEANLAVVDALLSERPEDAALADLRQRLWKQREAVTLWMETVEAIWGARLWASSGDPTHAAWALSALERLEDAAARWDDHFSSDPSPVSTDRARRCAQTLRGVLPEVAPQERAWPRISAPTLRWDASARALEVTVEADSPSRFVLSWGLDAVRQPNVVAGEGFSRQETLRAVIPEGVGRWIVVRVSATDQGGASVEGSDWWFAVPETL